MFLFSNPVTPTMTSCGVTWAAGITEDGRAVASKAKLKGCFITQRVLEVLPHFVGGRDGGGLGGGRFQPLPVTRATGVRGKKMRNGLEPCGWMGCLFFFLIYLLSELKMHAL